MMPRNSPYFQWLALAALAEWLIVRTISRAAIHLPKSPAMIEVYGLVNRGGQLATTFVTLLSLVLLSWIAAWEWRRRAIFLPLVLILLAALSLAFLVLVAPPWLALVYQLLTLIVLVRLGLSNPRRALAVLPASALMAGTLFQMLPNLYAALAWAGPPPLTGQLFNLGELLVVTSLAVWWWIAGRSRSWRLWLAATVPALLFAASFQRDPAMTGILAIWSTGLTLFLPWPIYAVALCLAGVTVLHAWRRNPPLASAILLFTAAGYPPQLSSQLFCALIGLWLLARPVPSLDPPRLGQARPVPVLR